MRKVIPHIASEFRKDRNWLRRSQPAQRNYQIVLAVDSSSMTDIRFKRLAFECVALISKAFCLLEAGQLESSLLVNTFNSFILCTRPLTTRMAHGIIFYII